LKCAKGIFDCYDPLAKGHCCFNPDGNDLRIAVRDYKFFFDSGLEPAHEYGKVIGNWCVDYVKDFSRVFYYLEHFDEPLTNWNTSSAETMDSMFRSTEAFNQPVNFDTSKVTSMERMFEDTHAFNHPVHFQTNKVNNMERMFARVHAFNQPVHFDTSKVTTMKQMFAGAVAYNKPVTFDTSNVVDFTGMFDYAHAFNQAVHLKRQMHRT
jgi:hypothetical protein